MDKLMECIARLNYSAMARNGGIQNLKDGIKVLTLALDAAKAKNKEFIIPIQFSATYQLRWSEEKVSEEGIHLL
jgi:hypothetical protein